MLQKGITSKELSIRSGYSPAQISCALNGIKPNKEVYNPTLDFILNVSLGLKIGEEGFQKLVSAHPEYSKKFAALRNRKTILTME